MTDLRKTQENCLVCVASTNPRTSRTSTATQTEWVFISGWSRDDHGMVTPDLNNFKGFDNSGMNEMTFYS